MQVHHLQSGQVINDGLNSAVKELVENALDANATSIEIRFKNYGLESLEVIDNGDGISPDNYESIGSRTPSPSASYQRFGCSDVEWIGQP